MKITLKRKKKPAPEPIEWPRDYQRWTSGCVFGHGHPYVVGTREEFVVGMNRMGYTAVPGGWICAQHKNLIEVVKFVQENA